MQRAVVVIAVWLAVCGVGLPAAHGVVGGFGAVLSADGYGVVVGAPMAPVQLDIFIEPQCPPCAQFESDYGDRLADRMGRGQLAVTYRPLTFLDGANHNDTSAVVSNALFVAAGPDTSARAFQGFVQDLERQLDPHGEGPSNDDIAAMARQSGVPEQAASRIAAGEPGVDVAAMDAANTARIEEEGPQDWRTPMVYDLNTKQVLGIQDPGWIDNLFS